MKINHNKLLSQWNNICANCFQRNVLQFVCTVKNIFSQVKEDNSEIATMERQISEVQEQIRQLQDECQQLDQVRLNSRLFLTAMKGINDFEYDMQMLSLKNILLSS